MAEPAILVLNTTFKGIALCVYQLSAHAAEFNEPKRSATVFEAKSHSAALKLPELTTMVLADAGIALADLAGIAVAHGPGSFTGIKIGLAFVQGLVAGTALPVLGCDPLACLGQHGAADYRRHPWLLAQNRRKGYLYSSGHAPQTVWLVPGSTKGRGLDQGLWLAPLNAATAGDPSRTPWPPSLTEVGLVSPWQELQAALPDGVATVAADPERFGLAANDAMAASFAKQLATGPGSQALGKLPAEGLKANYITPSTPEERQLEAQLAAQKPK